MTAQYRIELPAFLPTGPLNPKTHQATFELHGQGDLEFAGEPNYLWTALNDEALTAQRSLLKKYIERQEENIKAIPPEKNKLAHTQKLARLKQYLADLRVGSADPTARPEEPSTMSEVQKGATPQGLQLKSNRPSDNPNRR
jgi:hypothetical protein